MNRHTTTYIALGSNVGDRRQYIADALEMLNTTEHVAVRRTSNIIETPPLGDADAPSYLNAVTELQTTLSSEELFRCLRRIEDSLGRTRRGKWSPRTIDLDLLLFDDQVIDTPALTVPHRQMHLRSFVLKPLCELAPDLLHPILMVSMTELADRLNGADFMLDAERPRLVSIAGNIGAGKTTLATALQSLLDGKTLREPYDTNPFLPEVYAGKTELALDSQLYFLVKRAEQLAADALAPSSLWFADYVFQKELIYARLLLDPEQLALYQSIYDHFAEEIVRPSLVIYLADPPAECLERIHKRNRPYEQDINTHFLRNLDAQYTDLFAAWYICPVIRLSSSEIDYSKQDSIQHLADQVKYYTIV